MNPTEVVLELLLSIVEILVDAAQTARAGSADAAFASVALKCTLRALHANLVAASIMRNDIPDSDVAAPSGQERAAAPVTPSPFVFASAGAAAAVPALAGGGMDGGAAERFEKFVRAPRGGLCSRISSVLVDCASWRARSRACSSSMVPPLGAAPATHDALGEGAARAGAPSGGDAVGPSVHVLGPMELQAAAAQAWGGGLAVVLPTPVQRSMLLAELLATAEDLSLLDMHPDVWSMLFVAACQRLSCRDVADLVLPSHIPLSSSLNSDLRLGGGRATSVRLRVRARACM